MQIKIKVLEPPEYWWNNNPTYRELPYEGTVSAECAEALLNDYCDAIYGKGNWRVDDMGRYVHIKGMGGDAVLGYVQIMPITDLPPFAFDTPAAQAYRLEAKMRMRYRELVHAASNEKEAAELIAICSELDKRGYRLNEDESDWIK